MDTPVTTQPLPGNALFLTADPFLSDEAPSSHQAVFEMIQSSAYESSPDAFFVATPEPDDSPAILDLDSYAQTQQKKKTVKNPAKRVASSMDEEDEPKLSRKVCMVPFNA